MTTRAIHFEIVSFMDTRSCVMGTERLIARRGTPSVIWSNNGTKIVRTEKKLLNCFQSWNKKAPAELAKNDIPAASHHIGSWERLIRCCKRVSAH